MFTTLIHPFEKAGLGKAPFHCVGVRENWFEMPGFGRKPGGTCHYCGTGILYEYVINSSNGKQFVVGCDCVRKTGGNVNNFDSTRREHARKQRAAKAEGRRAARKAEWEAEKLARQTARAELAATWKTENIGIVNALEVYDGTNKFLLSMKEQLTSWGMLTERQLISTVAAFEAAKRLAGCEFVGTIGQRMKNVNVRVVKCMTVGVSTFGYRETPRVLVTLETDAGDQLTWWTTHHETVSTEFYPAAFTVKDHTEYQGTKQTVVQRVNFK